MGVVETMHQWVPTERAIAPGPMGRGRLLETLSGRRPRDRLAECGAHHATALLLGQAIAPGPVDADTVGRGGDRLSDTGPMQVGTACAGRADPVFRCATRSGHFATPSRTVYGAYALPEETEEPQVPCPMPYGCSQDKRPALQPCGCAPRCVERAVPLWGTPKDGHAAAPTVHHPRWSTRATCLAKHGGAPGAYIDVAEAALGTADNRAALGDPVCITRCPAP
jgi:hypothetical protein